MKRRRDRARVIACALFLATLASTLWVGAERELGRPPGSLAEWALGARFALPLLAILVAHEAGHYLAAMRRGVRASPPMFIPVPFALLGTMGAVIGLHRVRRREAMLEIGAAGPLAGMLVALPVLAFGLTSSPIEALPTSPYLLEGRSLLYVALVRVFAGPIGPGQDVMLTPTAFAGWAGLLVTMANLVPVGTLDGGHVARAWLGPGHARLERAASRVLLAVGALVSLTLGVDALRSGRGPTEALSAASGGFGWLVWSLVIALLRQLGGDEPEERPQSARSRRDARRLRRAKRAGRSARIYAAMKRRRRLALAERELAIGHRALAVGTLALFPLLFMPFWLRIVVP